MFVLSVKLQLTVAYSRVSFCTQKCSFHSFITAVSVVCCRSFGKEGREEASKGGVSLLSLR